MVALWATCLSTNFRGKLSSGFEFECSRTLFRDDKRSKENVIYFVFFLLHKTIITGYQIIELSVFYTSQVTQG